MIHFTLKTTKSYVKTTKFPLKRMKTAFFGANCRFNVFFVVLIIFAPPYFVTLCIFILLY